MAADPALAVVFGVTLAAELGLGAVLVASRVDPRRRVWPPPARRSWQYRLVWALTAVATAGVVAVGFLDWNRLGVTPWLRLPVGIGLVLAGSGLALWGVRTLGVHRSLGLAESLVESGPYRFTRNPQYVGDIALLLGWAVLCSSLWTWIVSLLAAAWFALAPSSEEPWLREHYGAPYDAYRRRVPRFLGWPRDHG